MDERLKQRLVGAVVLVVAAVVFVPMLLDSRDAPSPPGGQGMASVPAPAPATEPQDATAEVIPLGGAASPDDGAREAPAEPPGGPAPARASAARPSPPESPSRAPAEKPAFAVQLASFSKSGNAEGLRDRLVAKGYSAYIVTTDSISRVYVGPQTSRAEAERVREKLLAETKLKGIVVEHAG